MTACVGASRDQTKDHARIDKRGTVDKSPHGRCLPADGDEDPDEREGGEGKRGEAVIGRQFEDSWNRSGRNGASMACGDACTISSAISPPRSGPSVTPLCVAIIQALLSPGIRPAIV